MSLITLERKRIDPHRLYGEIVAESEELLLVHQEVDFQFDGYVVVRKKDITRREATESTDYGEKLMKEEGLWEEAPAKITGLPVDSWHSLLNQFVGKVVILENERTDNFHIGRVLRVDDKGVNVLYFDGAGKFEGEKRVSFRNLTSVTFGNRYSTIHEKYLEM